VSAFYAPLKNEALLQVAGPDAQTFLQGQTTCDVREVEPQQAQPGAYCNAQGRVWADFIMVALGLDHFALRLRADIAAATLDTFSKYIVFSKAEISRSPAWQIVGCWGESAAEALLPLVGALPDGQYACVSGEGFCLTQMDDTGLQYELYLDGKGRADLLQALSATLTPADNALWQALQIEAGIARIESNTVETFLPQVLNYDLLGYVNFKKGCYTGQEVVARLHYRGKSKRRMYVAGYQGNTAPPAGTALVTADGQQSVGTVVNAIAAPAGGVRMLVSVAEKYVDQALVLEGQDMTVSIEPPPYALDTERN